MHRKDPEKPHLIYSKGALIGKSVPSEHGGNRQIKILCPSCGEPLKARADTVGMKGRCPKCGHVLSIQNQKMAKLPPPPEGINTTDDKSDTQRQSDNEDNWDASVWKYYEHYINNVISKGSELGKHKKYIGLWWRSFQYIFDLAPAAFLIFLLRLDFNNSLWYSATVLASIFIFQIFLWSLLESSDFNGSLGKILLEFKVTTENGHRISLKRAIARNLIKAVMFLPPLCALFLLIGFDRKKRGLHDRVARTVVVMESPTAFSWRKERRWFVLWVFAAFPFAVYFLLFM